MGSVGEENGEFVAVGVESAVGPGDVVGGDGIEIFFAELAFGFAGEGAGFGGEAAEDLGGFLSRGDRGEDIGGGFPLDDGRPSVFLSLCAAG